MIRPDEKFHRIINREGPDTSLSLKLLTGFSRIYAKAAGIKADLYEYGVLKPVHLPRPVISVGNLTIGGTGKTPAAVFLARLLKETGLRPAILSRGYGGNMQKSGGLVSDGRQVMLSTAESGDEPCLMALKLPGVAVAVGRNRAESAFLCLKGSNCDIFILDDGFQHLALFRDINILLADAGRPFGNRRTLPRGPLREEPYQIKRADALVLTRALPFSPAPREWPEDRPVFRACHRPTGLLEHRFLKAPGPVADTRPMLPLSSIKGQKIAAFSGIADNSGFFDTLAGLGGKIVHKRGFDDHHHFSDSELCRFFSEAGKCGADIIVTTEKDAVRITEIPNKEPPLLALCVEFSFYEPCLFSDWLKRRIKSI